MSFTMLYSTDKNHFSLREYITRKCIVRGPGSSVGIKTGYLLNGPEIETRWGQDFPHLSRPALELTQPPVQWVPGLSGVKSGRGVTLTPHRLLLPWSRKSRAIPRLPIMGRTACTEPQCLCKRVHCIYIYMSCSDTHRTPQYHTTP